MEVAILILLVISLLFNLLVAVVLVRTRESVEGKMDRQNKDTQRLIQEVMLRLPPRPYGVNVEERYRDLPMSNQVSQ